MEGEVVLIYRISKLTLPLNTHSSIGFTHTHVFANS